MRRQPTTHKRSTPSSAPSRSWEAVSLAQSRPNVLLRNHADSGNPPMGVGLPSASSITTPNSQTLRSHHSYPTRPKVPIAARADGSRPRCLRGRAPIYLPVNVLSGPPFALGSSEDELLLVRRQTGHLLVMAKAQTHTPSRDVHLRR